MSETFVPRAEGAQVGVIELDEGGAVLKFVFRLPACVEISDDCMDTFILGNTRRFLKFVTRTRRRFQFVLDARACDTLPLLRLYEFQAFVRARASDQVDAYLDSTTILVGNRAIAFLIEGALRAFPPRRPLFVVRHDATSGVDDVTRFDGL